MDILLLYVFSVVLLFVTIAAFSLALGRLCQKAARGGRLGHRIEVQRRENNALARSSKRWTRDSRRTCSNARGV